MPDLDLQIREYLDATSKPLTVDEILTHPVGNAPVRPLTDRRTKKRVVWKSWYAGAAAMAAVLVVIGFLSLLVSTRPPDVGNRVPTPTTTPGRPPSTTLTPSPGGPLRFTAIEQPNGEGLYKGAWFRGAFYALGDEGSVYRTADGLTWSPVSFPSDPENADSGWFQYNEIETDGNRLVLLADSGHETVGAETCAVAEFRMRAVVIDERGEARSSEIDLPIPDRSRCFSVGTRLAVGPKGILIAGSIASPSGSGEVAFGVHSVDGDTWTSLERSGPFSSAQVEPVMATPDGFLAAPTGPERDGPVYFSSDGINWQPMQEALAAVYDQSFEWRGRLLVETSDGFAPFDDLDQVLVPADLIPAERLFFGEMGIIGGAGGGYFNDIPAHSISFSVDGTTWHTWAPPEFASIGQMVGYIGMGEDFVVFTDAEGQRLWIGTASG